MAQHLVSPLARQDIRLDITDLYVVPGETGTVLAINACHSIFDDVPAPDVMFGSASNTPVRPAIGRTLVTAAPSAIVPYAFAFPGLEG